MAIKKSELYSSLWASCDELRGGMDASQYKDYVLVMLFVKYVSDKYADVPFGAITVPEGASFNDMVELKGNKDIGNLINTNIITPLKEANNLTDMPDFNDATKLGEGKEMTDRLTNLIAIFEKPELDFSGNRAEGDDILGDAYEYLMRHFASESGKSKGQFYTPSEVSRIMADIIGIKNANTTAKTEVYDPTCGSGSLLLKISGSANSEVTLYGQEKDSATSALARMNMILHDNPTAEIKQGNTLANPLFKEENQKLQQFDYVVANPPFSDKRWSNGLSLPEDGTFNRFMNFGVPPAKNGDYAYLLHIVRSLKRMGKGAVVLPHGVLFRGNAESEIRKNLLKQGYIKAIIGLPANLFYGTGIPACIILIDKENAENRKGVFMMDASKGFIKDGNKNRLREQDIRLITDVFDTQETVKGFSRMVPMTEIEENEYNLNIPRYIDNQEKEDIQDIDAHLNGGIPNQDLDGLSKYWEVFPTLKSSLAEPIRDGYSELKVATDQVNDAIYNHGEFTTFLSEMETLYSSWSGESKTYLEGLDKECHPKKVIADLALSLLEGYNNKPLVNKYNVFQHLMTYWNDVMQDDTYMISYEGWVATTQRIYGLNNKKEKVDKGWDCDLVPKVLVMNRFFATERDEVNELKNQLEQVTSTYKELEEEHGGEEQALNGVTTIKGAQENQEEFIGDALSEYAPELGEEREAELKLITDGLASQVDISGRPALNALKDTKGNLKLKDVKAGLDKQEAGCEGATDIHAWLDADKQIKDARKELKKVNLEVDKKLAELIAEDATRDYLKELVVIAEYIELRNQEKTLKADIKEKEEALDDLLLAKYPKLTVEEIKQLVVEDKWLPTISNAIKGELDQTSQGLTGRIKVLAERYETALPAINTEVADLETTVNDHLAKMGYSWN